MKAIQTHYLSATERRGSRIKATAEGGNSVTISYDHASNNVHRKAAQALADKMGWAWEMIEGGLPNGDTVFVFRDSYGVSTEVQQIQERHKGCLIVEAGYHAELEAVLAEIS